MKSSNCETNSRHAGAFFFSSRRLGPNSAWRCVTTCGGEPDRGVDVQARSGLLGA